MAAAFIISILRSKIFWIILAVIVIAIIIRRNWYRIADFGKPRYVELEKDEDGKVVRVSEQRETELRDLANEIHTFINSPSSLITDNPKYLNTLKYLNDQELLYLSRYYKNVFENKLFTDIDDEILPWTNADDEILTRLQKMGQS